LSLPLRNFATVFEVFNSYVYIIILPPFYVYFYTNLLAIPVSQHHQHRQKRDMSHSTPFSPDFLGCS